MALTASDVKPGDKLEVPSRTGKVIEVYAPGSTVLVELDDGTRCYVFYNRLLKELPYVPGQRYLAATGQVYTFGYDEDGATPQWTAGTGTVREFSYPPRPLRPVTAGAEITE